MEIFFMIAMLLITGTSTVTDIKAALANSSIDNKVIDVLINYGRQIASVISKGTKTSQNNSNRISDFLGAFNDNPNIASLKRQAAQKLREIDVDFNAKNTELTNHINQLQTEIDSIKNEDRDSGAARLGEWFTKKLPRFFHGYDKYGNLKYAKDIGNKGKPYHVEEWADKDVQKENKLRGKQATMDKLIKEQSDLADKYKQESDSAILQNITGGKTNVQE